MKWMNRGAAAMALLCVGAMVVHVHAQDRGRGDGNFGRVIAGIEPVLERAFNDGRVHFQRRLDAADGLGPVFNERSCSACHSTPATGGSGNRTVTRVGRVGDNRFDSLDAQGGSLLQVRGIGQITTRSGDSFTFVGEQVPADANVVSRRRTTALFGLGLVDAVPDSTFMALARVSALRNDGTGGRVNIVTNLETGAQSVGKFGWKAQVPSLLQFSADAYLNEMGLTNPLFPEEVCPQGDCSQLEFNPAPAQNDNGTRVLAATDFMRFMAPPPRAEITDDVTRGEAVFRDIGCASCHVATLRTGRNDVAALSEVTFQPYSDFLLHDMGSLGDGIEQGLATGREFRTAPLWGLRVQRRLLHDGSADSAETAIQRHDGQGARARDRFSSLDTERSRVLRAFLGSL